MATTDAQASVPPAPTHTQALAETAAQEAVVAATVRAVLGCVVGFDESVLTAIGAALQAVVPFHRLAIFVEEDGGKSFRVLWRARAAGAPEAVEVPMGSRLASVYVRDTTGPDPATAAPEIVEDMAVRTSPMSQMGRRAGLLSYVRLPLVHDGVGYGWWLVGHDVVGAPSQRALPLLQRLATIIAPAVARARVAVRYALLRALLEESPDGMLGIDQGLRVSESNAAADRMLGRTRAQVIGAKLVDLVGEPVATMLARAAEGSEGSLSFALPEPKQGAPPLWVDAVVARVSGTTEASVQLHLRDARARRAAEEGNAQRVEQLAFQRALGEVMASDLRADRSLGRAVDLCFVRFELGTLCALRREPDGMLRLVASHGAGPLLKAKLARISEADLERLVLVMPARTPARGPATVEATGVRLPDDAPEDGTRWARLAPLVHARRGLGALLAVGHAGDAPQAGDRDVWDRIASTISVALHAADDYEQVVALEAANRQLVDNLPVIVARFDPDTGATSFVNGALERVLGVRPADAVGRGIQSRLADPLEGAEFERARARAARGQDTEWQDRRYRHADGRVLTMRERVYPVFDAEGMVNAVELIAYDVTTELESRKALMQADRLASLGALAAGIAHEINNPVAFLVLAAAQVGRLIDSLGDPASGAEDRLREIAQELGEASGRIADIVGELKLFTRMSDGTSRIPIDVNRVLRTALTLTSSELRRRARLEVVLSDVPLAPGAFATLGQVFVNLLINASQALDAKSESGPAENHVVRVTSETSGRSIVVRVSDTGVGIAPELLPRIFDPFFTTKASGQGAGLGLAIAYDLVRRVGGDIRVQSAPGKGTTFEVILPLEIAPESEEEGRGALPTPRAPGEPSMVEHAGPQAARRRVLIIDDERALVKALSRQLHERYEVEMASTASEALAKLSSKEYDAIVCDLRMPDQSGPAIYEAALARSARQASRFIFTTGGSYGLEDDGLHEQVTATGRPLLEKPFDGVTFEQMVARVASGSIVG